MCIIKLSHCGVNKNPSTDLYRKSKDAYQGRLERGIHRGEKEHRRGNANKLCKCVVSQKQQGWFCWKVWCCVFVATMMGSITSMQWARAREAKSYTVWDCSAQQGRVPHKMPIALHRGTLVEGVWLHRLLVPSTIPALQRGLGMHSALYGLQCKTEHLLINLSQPVSFSDVSASNVIKTSKDLSTLT